jgi:hypothetical protein
MFRWEQHCELRRFGAVERRSAQFSAVAGSSEQLCRRTVRTPLTCDYAMTCSDAGAVQRSSAALDAVQRRWERSAALNLLPPQATDAHIAATSLTYWPNEGSRSIT